MSSISDLKPGDLGFGPIRGGAGLLVSAGQLMLGEGFRVGKLDIRHVFVVVRGGNEPGWPQVVEAEPGGAQLRAIADGRLLVDVDNRWTDEYAYVRIPEDYPGQAADAAAIARAMIGTPYSFASYAALAAWRMGWKTPKLERWIDRRKSSVVSGLSDNVPYWTQDGSRATLMDLPREAICSVLADQAWSLTGKKIMQGVAHQCVTPGALAGRLLTMDGVDWMWPGR